MLVIRAPALDELARRWGVVEPIVKRATDLTDGCFDPVDVLGQALSGSLMVWLIEDGPQVIAIAVTEVRQYPRKRVCDIPFIAGDRMAEWIVPLRDTLADHAKKFGCTKLRAWGRPGWERVPGLDMKRQSIMDLDI